MRNPDLVAGNLREDNCENAEGQQRPAGHCGARRLSQRLKCILASLSQGFALTCPPSTWGTLKLLHAHGRIVLTWLWDGG